MWKKLTCTVMLFCLAAAGAVQLGAKPPKGEPPPSGPGLIALQDGRTIVLINPDGTGATPVAVGDYIGSGLAWSPMFFDGTVKLAYATHDWTNQTASLNVVNVFDGVDTPAPSLNIGDPAPVQGLAPRSVNNLDWSSAEPGVNGTQRVRVAYAAYTGESDTAYVIHIVDLIYNPQNIAGHFSVDTDKSPNPAVVRPGDGAYYWVPRFSPNGNWLALARYDRQEDGSWHGSIELADADGSGPTWLIDGQYPAWSPDSSQLAFVRTPDIYVATLVIGGDGKPTVDSIRQLTQTKNPNDFKIRPTWSPESPDGTQIAYQMFGAKSGLIGKVLVDTGIQYNKMAKGWHPDWSPMDLPKLP